MTPDEWLADFEANMAELQRNAAGFCRKTEDGYFSKPSSASTHLR